MRKTRIEKETAEILSLPTNEFTFYRNGESLNYSLFIHYKHFDAWISMYNNEAKLMDVGSFILGKLGLTDDLDEECYINVHLKGQDKAVHLYSYDYMNHNLIQTKPQMISLCEWDWFN